MDLEFLLNQVKRAIFDDPSTPQREGNDPTGLIGQIEKIFGSAKREEDQGGMGNVRPASEDPLGDPADQYPSAQPASYPSQQGEYNDPRFGNVKPASEDPLGDPADEGTPASTPTPYNDPRYPNLKPASEDPLGDPADEGR